MMDKDRYPPDWKQISLRIRERDGWRCKQCGLPNGAEIVRSSVNPAEYLIYDTTNDVYTTRDGDRVRLSEIPEEFNIYHHTRVVLTVHHIGAPYDDGRPGDPHDKLDVRDCNLEALCQRCHFIKDLPSHIVHARLARMRKRDRRRQQEGNVPLI